MLNNTTDRLPHSKVEQTSVSTGSVYFTAHDVIMTLVMFSDSYTTTFFPSYFLWFPLRRPCSGWQVMSFIFFYFDSMTPHRVCITFSSSDNHTTTHLTTFLYGYAGLSDWNDSHHQLDFRYSKMEDEEVIILYVSHTEVENWLITLTQMTLQIYIHRTL